MRVLIVLTLGPAGCLVASYLMARFLVASNGGFGAGDISPFIYTTLYFAVVLLLPSLLLMLFLRNLHIVNRIWISMLTGALLGFLWTVFNRWMLGPWFGAWSFAVLYCWIVGGAVGMLPVTICSKTPNKTTASRYSPLVPP